MDVPDEVRLTSVLIELAVAVLTDTSLRADLERLTRLAAQLIPDCSGASVSMLVDGQPTTMAVTDRVALQLDLVQYDHDDGPCVASLSGETIRIGFLPADERFPHFAAGAADQRVLSVLSTPAIDHGTVVGSLNLYSRRAEGFDESARETAAVIAAEVANALVKSSVLDTAQQIRGQLQEEHDETALVSRAQGVLMAVQDCSAAQAGALIRNAAQDNAEAVIRTAERILATVRRDDRPPPPG